MPFLSSQSSRFDPNFRNQVRKPDFGCPAPGRLATLEKHQKWPKSAVFALIPVLMVLYGKNSHKFCLGGVLRHLEAKSIHKIINFQFLNILLDFSKKNFEKAKTHDFGLRFLIGWFFHKVLMIF